MVCGEPLVNFYFDKLNTFRNNEKTIEETLLEDLLKIYGRVNNQHSYLRKVIKIRLICIK